MELRSAYALVCGLTFTFALSGSAFAVPIKITFTGSPEGTVNIITDSNNTFDLSVTTISDPIYGDSTFIIGNPVIYGPDPGPPSGPPLPPNGNYTYYQEYTFQIVNDFAVSDPLNFMLNSADLVSSQSTYRIASYEVKSDGSVSVYEDGPSAFQLSSFSVSTNLSAVPLPASAPLFGAALLGLAGLGYAAKRKVAAA